MELNKRKEMNEPPLLAIGRPGYDIVATENEHQAGASTWSPVDCNGAGSSSMNDIWHADWRPYSDDLSQAYAAQSQHRAKRQHCWGATSTMTEDQGVGPSISHDEDSMKSVHTEHYGCCETVNAGNAGFDFFQSSSNPASSTRPPCPPQGIMLVNNTRQANHSEAEDWNAGIEQGMGLGSFVDSDWKVTRDLMSTESTESNKGKGVQPFHANAGGSDIEVSGCQESSYFPNILASQPENEIGSSGSPIDCMLKPRTDELHGDSRSTCKRKISPLEFAEPTPFNPRFITANESATFRVGGFGTSSDQAGFTNFHPFSNSSTIPFWGGSRHECNEHVGNNSHSPTGPIERTSDLIGSREETSRSLHNQQFGIPPSDTQSQTQSHLLITRNHRRHAQTHSLTRRGSDSGSGNVAGGINPLAGSDHWPALMGERSLAPPPAMTNWGPSSGARRNISAFTSPVSRERGNLQGGLEGSRFRSMPGRTLDWAMAAAAAAAPAASEHRPTSQLFGSRGVVAPAGREVDLPESSARITQAATSFFNSGVLASYFTPSGSNTQRVNVIPPPPAVSAAPSHAGPPSHVGSPLEATASVAGQHAGRYATLSPSHGRREALFSAPVQSLLGLPFRGIHTLRADGEYRRQFLSEILNAMHHAFRGEDLNIEELVMLDPSIIYGGGDAHDQHRDMRLDVDNMTYEELLALEERIGSVSTGLDEEKISLSLRESKYSSLDATVAAISQDSDVKCSVCQEEFVEDDELGRLDCGHGYHSACIKRWLLQKNECPICKAAAHMNS